MMRGRVKRLGAIPPRMRRDYITGATGEESLVEHTEAFALLGCVSCNI